ncbi:MAG: helix-turn-helix domain-containing protein [Pseudomonadota bacterium]
MEINDIHGLKEKISFYEAVLDNIHNGVMITDPEGKIIFFSKTYGTFLGIDPEKVIGKDCTEVVENSRMHIVAHTGIPEINEDMEKEALIHAIRMAKDNKNKAAKLLGIHRTALYKKMKKLNIPVSITTT